MRLLSFALCFLVFPLSLLSQQTPLPAGKILGDAFALASKENKHVLVIFHASWCGWCRRMDSSINNKTCKDLFDTNYIIRHLVVYEAENKKNLENPGALDVLTKYKGNDQGLPYWMVFDKAGKLLADSQMRPGGYDLSASGNNTGCPATKEEVAHFISVLKKTSSLKAEQLLVIEEVFRRNEQK